MAVSHADVLGGGLDRTANGGASTATVSVLFTDLVDSTAILNHDGADRSEAVRRSHFGNAAIFQQHVHGRVDAGRRVDQVAALDQQTGPIFPHACHRIFPIARARIAMRMGTPLCTSSRMRA